MQKMNENFNSALEFCDKDFSHEDYIEFLKHGNVYEKQYSALNLHFLKDKNEAKILLSNLVGVDGKIREVVALKVSEFTEKYPEFFIDEEDYETFSKATIDIDGNVCRLAIVSANNLKSDEKFSKFYANEMIKIIEIALDEISKFTFRDKKYKINKQVFKIYWALEGLIYFNTFVDYQILKDVLIKCANLPEYTVREKVAKIICIIRLDSNLQELKQQLKNDENYYVRNIFQ